MAKTQKTLAKQLTCAQERARTTTLDLVMIGQGAQGDFKAVVTSERDRSVEYTITYGEQTHDLTCSCPATVICKHIGYLLNRGIDFHSNGLRPEDVPVTPNPNRQPQPEPPAPATSGDALSDVLASMPSQQRCTCCGEIWHVKTLAQHYVCPRCARTDREQVEDYWREFPLLMDIAAEVAAVEAQMAAEGCTWSKALQTWVRIPSGAPDANSVLVEVAR
jgi:hypothetical protein